MISLYKTAGRVFGGVSVATTAVGVCVRRTARGHRICLVSIPRRCTSIRQCSTVAERIVNSPYTCKDPPENVPFHDFLMSRFDEFGDSTAVIDGQTGHRYSYVELRDSVKCVGSALVRMGFKQGDVLCLYSHNVPEYAIIFLAVSALGGTVSAANPLYTVDELVYQVKSTEAKFIATVQNSVHTAQMVQERCTCLKEVIVIGEESVGCRTFSDLQKDDGSAFPTAVKINTREDVLALPYSSGTTGLPKGVMLTHHNIIGNIEQCIYPGGLTGIHGEDVWIGTLPFFHIYGQVVLLFLGLYQGVKIVTLPRFEPEVYLDCVQKHKASLLHLVPPIVLLMAKHPMIAQYDLSSVKSVLCAAAPCGDKLALEFKDKTGIPSIRQGYGLTETSPITHCCPLDNKYLGSIGLPVPNTECKVISTETGEALGIEEEGELLVRGPQIMKGYLHNDEATKNTVDGDGWLHTGDIGYYNEDGYFFISDRLKELIKYKGFQVAPAELEAILVTHPDVQDCVVIGIPDEEAGELPRAYVVKKTQTNPTEIDILEFVNVKVAPSKKLRAGVRFVDSIPKTASGKILRRLVRAKAISEQ